MKPRITVITVGVDDLEKSLRFYRDGLGLQTEGIVGAEFEHGAVAFFELQAGLKLALWPRKSISHDSGIPAENASATEFTLGHNVSSKAEVDAVMTQAKRAPLSPRQRMTRLGAATPATSRILTGICGRRCGTPNGQWTIEA